MKNSLPLLSREEALGLLEKALQDYFGETLPEGISPNTAKTALLVAARQYHNSLLPPKEEGPHENALARISSSNALDGNSYEPPGVRLAQRIQAVECPLPDNTDS